MDSNKKLIEMLLSNDINVVEEGLETIYNSYYKLVFYCVNKILNNSKDSEEITNDTFISVFNNRKKLVKSKNIKYYILETAKHKAIDLKRKEKLSVVVDTNEVYKTKSFDKKIDINYFIKSLENVLNDKEIDVIIKHLFEGMSFKDIAKELNEKTSCVSNRYYRALERIKERGNIYE